FIWTLGHWQFLIALARGQRPSLEIIFNFQSARWLIPAGIASLLISIMVGFGLVLLVVPGVIVLLMLSQSLYLIIDRDAGVFESMSLSRDVMRGNKLTLLMVGLTLFGL